MKKTTSLPKGGGLNVVERTSCPQPQAAGRSGRLPCADRSSRATRPASCGHQSSQRAREQWLAKPDPDQRSHRERRPD